LPFAFCLFSLGNLFCRSGILPDNDIDAAGSKSAAQTPRQGEGPGVRERRTFMPLTEQQKREIAGAVAEVDDAQIAASRHLSVPQKMEQAFSMIQIAEEVASYRLRKRRPELNSAVALQMVRQANVLPERMAEMTDETMQFRTFMRSVLNAIEAAEVDYLIGGAVAAWAWGEARTTRDFDVVVDLPLNRIIPFSQELARRGMAVPQEIIIDLLISPADLPIHAIHDPTGYKAEIFLLRPDDELRASALSRRMLVDLGPSIGEVYVHSPEDLIVYKLHFYGLSHQTKHIRDISSIVKTIGDGLEMEYIRRWVARLNLEDVWQNVWAQLEK